MPNRTCYNRKLSYSYWKRNPVFPYTTMSNKPLRFWLTQTKLHDMTGVRYVNSHPLIRGIEYGWNYSVRDGRGRVYVASGRGNRVGENCTAVVEHRNLTRASITDLLYCVGKWTERAWLPAPRYPPVNGHIRVNLRRWIITVPVWCKGWFHLSRFMLSARSLSTLQGWVGSYYLQYSNIVNNTAVY